MENLEVETYGIFSNVDATITKINSIVKDDGYEFIPISLHELELKFSEVFNISRNYNSKKNILKSISREEDGNLNTVSKQFDEALKIYFNLRKYSNNALEIGPDYEVYLLKRNENVYIKKTDNYRIINKPEEAQKKLFNFSKELIKKLRLFKNGQINLQGYFSILKEEREVISKYKTPIQPLYAVKKYTIEDDELEDLKKILENEIEVQEYLKLAIKSFELAYETPKKKIRFVLNIMALESIFNRGSRDPIAHIMARHASLLLSDNREDFYNIFKKVKKLYSIRCDIVHGTTNKTRLKKLKNKLDDKLSTLEEITRQVILKCMWLNNISNKKLLFDYLNKKGFEG